MQKVAFIFPGQGSQFIGMGRELAETYPAARAVFEEVDEALGEDLSGLIWSGDEAELKRTANTQPALMAVSVAAIRALEAVSDVKVAEAVCVAGHSLGEYSALAASGSVSVAQCARLLRIRGEAMQAAVAEGEGAMAALLGATPQQAAELCVIGAAEGGVCEIANDNAPGQIVISGQIQNVEAAMAGARQAGIRKAVRLPVSAPFHCSLMQPAADAMAGALQNVEFRPPSVPLIANVTARPCKDPDTIKKQLVAQVTGQVRWTESVRYIASQGVELLIEAGAGKVLSVMNRRTVKEIKGVTLGMPEEVEALVRNLMNTEE